jgi:hypothetical protein
LFPGASLNGIKMIEFLEEEEEEEECGLNLD